MKSDNWIDLNDGKMKGEEFFNLLIEEFSVLRENINEDNSDFIHFRMERFADYTMEKIKSENILELKRCFDFQESKIDLVHSDLINAITVSYCESLLLGDYRDKMNQIIILMGPKLRKIYIDYETYYNSLVEMQNKE